MGTNPELGLEVVFHDDTAQLIVVFANIISIIYAIFSLHIDDKLI